MVKDPVCGMEVDLSRSKLKIKYKGKTYYFCNASCHYAFQNNPEQFV